MFFTDEFSDPAKYNRIKEYINITDIWGGYIYKTDKWNNVNRHCYQKDGTSDEYKDTVFSDWQIMLINRYNKVYNINKELAKYSQSIEV